MTGEPQSGTPATPALHPCTPAGLPTIADLFGFMRQMRREADRIDRTHTEEWDKVAPLLGMSRDPKAEALGHAWQIEGALDRLAVTLPCKTLGEAAALLSRTVYYLETLGCILAPAGEAPHPGTEKAREQIELIHLVLANTVPLIAARAGVAVDDIEAQQLADRRAVLFGPINVEAGP
jgi:hypothetical protein